MRTALTGRTHGCTDQALRREDSPCQPGERPHMAQLRPAQVAAGVRLPGGYCCKTILGAWASNIDLRTARNEQNRFKNSFARIRLLRASYPPTSFATWGNSGIEPDKGQGIS